MGAHSYCYMLHTSQGIQVSFESNLKFFGYFHEGYKQSHIFLSNDLEKGEENVLRVKTGNNEIASFHRNNLECSGG